MDKYIKTLKELYELGNAILNQEQGSEGQLEEIEIMSEHIQICIDILERSEA